MGVDGKEAVRPEKPLGDATFSTVPMARGRVQEAKDGWQLGTLGIHTEAVHASLDAYDGLWQLGVLIHSFAFCLLSLALSIKLQLPFCRSNFSRASFASSHERCDVNITSLLPLSTPLSASSQ